MCQSKLLFFLYFSVHISGQSAFFIVYLNWSPGRMLHGHMDTCHNYRFCCVSSVKFMTCSALPSSILWLWILMFGFSLRLRWIFGHLETGMMLHGQSSRQTCKEWCISARYPSYQKIFQLAENFQNIYCTLSKLD